MNKLNPIKYIENMLSHHPKSISLWITEGIVINGERYIIKEFRLRDGSLYAVIAENKYTPKYFEVKLAPDEETLKDIYQAIKENKISIEKEVTDRKNEIARVDTAIKANTTKIEQEIADRQNEITRVDNAINANTAKINKEIQDRKNEITHVDGAISANTEKINQEITDRTNEINRVDNKITALEDKSTTTNSQIAALDKATKDNKAEIDQEIIDRKREIDRVDKAIEANTAKINKEITERQNEISRVDDTMSSIHNNALADHAEVAKARGYFRTLAEHLSAIDEKATTKLDAIVSGSPKKVFATLGELQSNFPKGAEGVFVVSENGHWYYWNGSAWEDGGAYQSAVLADYQKGSYLIRVLDKVKKVQSNFKILTIEEPGPLYESTTFSNDSVKVAPGGHFFPRIRLNDAQDVFVTLYNVNYPNRIKVGIKSADGSIIKTFDLKGSSADKIYCIDLNDYLGVTSEIGAYIEIRFDNRNQSDILTIDKFLVGKGGIPVSKEDSLLYDDINTIKRVANTNLVKTNINLLDGRNTSQTRISDSKITVEPSGYYFPVIAMNKAKDIYITLYGVNHPERIRARIKRGWDDVVESFDLPGSVADDVYYLNLNDYLDAGAQPDDEFEIRFDNRDQSDILTIDKFLVGKGGIPVDFLDNQKEVYVDSTATSEGIGTVSSPFLTIQEALKSGAETILVKAGAYKGPITASNRERLTIRAVTESDYNASTKPDVEGVTVTNVVKLKLTSDNGLFSTDYSVSSSSRLYRVFISKTLPVLDGETRSVGYNVTLWEDTGDIATSKRLVPVLTKSDCQSQEGTFYYDDKKIFVHATDGSVEGKTYKLLDEENVVAAFSNIAHLNISGIKFEGGNDNVVSLRNITQFDFTNVEASKSGLQNGISCNDSNGTFTSCKAFHNRNDGFNFHGFGDTHLIDCEGHYNFDDGNSHHDGCTGTVIRGEWSHNGKGGCSPTYGSIVHLDSVYSHHNRFGLYCDAYSTHPKRTVRHSNCVLKDNTDADYLIAANYTVLGMSNSFTTKVGGGEYIQLK